MIVKIFDVFRAVRGATKVRVERPRGVRGRGI